MSSIAEILTGTDLDKLSINTIRALSIDAVQQAKSGHPGKPGALAPLGLRHLESRHAIRSERSDLAKSRSFRAVEWSRVDAAVVGAASRAHAGRKQ